MPIKIEIMMIRNIRMNKNYNSNTKKNKDVSQIKILCKEIIKIRPN